MQNKIPNLEITNSEVCQTRLCEDGEGWKRSITKRTRKLLVVMALYYVDCDHGFSGIYKNSAYCNFKYVIHYLSIIPQ